VKEPASFAERVKVVLVSPRNPLNIGAAARAMSNFGFLRMALVNPYEVAFREAKSAVNASAVLEAAIESPGLADAVADCTLVVGTASRGNRELQMPLRRLEPGARIIRKHAGPIALVFGSEKFGLSNDDIARCDWLMRIPTRDEHESMNLGQSVAVCLYELIRHGRAPLKDPQGLPAARGEDLERLAITMMELLETSGYTNPKTVGSTTLKIRRMVQRLGLDRKDAEMWLGMLKQIRWKLKREE
jgi:tRNA/rRNA methyltransferase